MRRLGIITFLAFVLVGLFIYPHTESYCFFNPSIDTQFAPGYSEFAFKKIAVGDRKQTVRKLLGKPLEVREGSDGAEHWMYSRDGKARWGDWAWLGRFVTIKDDRVVEIMSRTYHD